MTTLIEAADEEALVKRLSTIYALLSSVDADTVDTYTTPSDHNMTIRTFIPRMYVKDTVGEWTTVREPDEYTREVAWIGRDVLDRRAIIKITPGGGVSLSIDGEVRVYHGNPTH